MPRCPKKPRSRFSRSAASSQAACSRLTSGVDSARKPDEVAQEIEATDSVLGDPDTVRRFVADALQRFGGGS
jgi:hypothetical protein